jgi:RNA polymerase sigma-70 factor (ECF subfamily)
MAVTTDFARRRFVEMVLPHLDEAYRLARWLTGNGTDAEDVVQDACLKALASLDATVVERPRAWVMTIVRNAAYTWLAKNKSKAVDLTGDMEALEAAAASDSGARPLDPEESLIAAADEAMLEAAIQALPPAYREVVVMRDVNGMSYREIAEAIDAPQGTVMSRLARGRALLIERIGTRA